MFMSGYVVVMSDYVVVMVRVWGNGEEARDIEAICELSGVGAL